MLRGVDSEAIGGLLGFIALNEMRSSDQLVVTALPCFEIADVIGSELFLVEEPNDQVNIFGRGYVMRPNYRNKTESELRGIVELLL